MRLNQSVLHIYVNANPFHSPPPPSPPPPSPSAPVNSFHGWVNYILSRSLFYDTTYCFPAYQRQGYLIHAHISQCLWGPCLGTKHEFRQHTWTSWSCAGFILLDAPTDQQTSHLCTPNVASSVRENVQNCLTCTRLPILPPDPTFIDGVSRCVPIAGGQIENKSKKLKLIY